MVACITKVCFNKKNVVNDEILVIKVILDLTNKRDISDLLEKSHLVSFPSIDLDHLQTPNLYTASVRLDGVLCRFFP